MSLSSPGAQAAGWSGQRGRLSKALEGNLQGGSGTFVVLF
jgi:hypothetical protein